MAQWCNIVEAENISTRRKMRNPGVRRHIASRMRNLCEIQQNILQGRMRTDEYMHERRVSGQDKVRDIAKLYFHPSHIQHQLLTMVAERRIDRTLIRHTYASRKGYGQIACALQIKRNLRKYRGTVRWYGQGDVCKYYDSIRHGHIRHDLSRLFKDKKFVDAFVEPFERFAPDGKGIPLGIRPSQSTGNLVLSAFDHFMQEDVRADDYVRYLDDFIFTGATKGEVKRKMKRAAKYLEQRGFTLHVPKIHRVSEGVDMMGFVYYGGRNDMWWRKSDKKRWLRRCKRVTTPRRKRELDDAAWGMLKWGNTHCKRLWSMKTGRELPKKGYKRNNMGVKFGNSGIKQTERVDANGVPFFDAPRISMQMLLNKVIETDKWVSGVKTSQGEGRYAVRVLFMGDTYKLIANAVDIKTFFADMTRNHVTRLRTAFVDNGNMHYGVDYTRTEILEVDGRKVTEKDGIAVFEDTGEAVQFT